MQRPHQNHPYSHSHEYMGTENCGPINCNDNQRNGAAVFVKDPFGPPQRQNCGRAPMFVVPENYANWRSQFQRQQQMGFQSKACHPLGPCYLPVPHVPSGLSLGHKRVYSEEAGKTLPSARSVLGHEMVLPIRSSRPRKQVRVGYKVPVEREDILEAADILSTFHI